MKTALLITAILSVSACSSPTSYVRSDTVLGRVVIYRNGVAYFERSATVAGDTLQLSVPADKVDDFLRSLTVVDADTGEPTPVSYPTQPALDGGTGLIDMKIGLSGTAPHKLRLSYVTESPSWKPSYRLVLAKPGQVEVQAWAVVDNTSGEDWNQVKLGVGSSSAMSFRYDLHSVRNVARETLRSNDLFAQAPPTGASSYGQAGGAAPVLAELNDAVLAANDEAEKKLEAEPPAPMMMAERMERPGSRRGAKTKAAAPATALSGKDSASPSGQPLDNRMADVAHRLQSTRDQVVVEGFAEAHESDKDAASLARANRVREQLIRNGLPPEQVVAVGRGLQAGHAGGVRLVQTPPPPASKSPAPAASAQAQEPIGTAHFESQTAMSVARGSSAMVSILKKDASGEVVYFYDSETSRGNDTFPFKAIRLINPTDSVLEGGPVTVFGEGRFIGEGLVEPIPARSPAFVPFALDRQVLVERKNEERDEIARIITVQRGVFSTEAKHIRRTVLTLHNRRFAGDHSVGEPAGATDDLAHKLPGRRGRAEPGRQEARGRRH
jgi:hypothetical protein